jgi:hypothetical protein
MPVKPATDPAVEAIAVATVGARFEVEVGPSDRALRLDGAAAVARVGEIVDACLATPEFTCCRLRAGIDLRADVRSWTAETFDHLSHLGGWFYALRQVLESGGAGTAEPVRTWVWDMSCLVVSRAGDRILLHDERVASAADGPPAPDAPWMPIAVPIAPLARELAREGRAMQAVCAALRQEIERRGFSLPALAARIAPLGDMPHAALGDHELVLAIVAREIELPWIWTDVDRIDAWLAAG